MNCNDWRFINLVYNLCFLERNLFDWTICCCKKQETNLNLNWLAFFHLVFFLLLVCLLTYANPFFEHPKTSSYRSNKKRIQFPWHLLWGRNKSWLNTWNTEFCSDPSKSLNFSSNQLKQKKNNELSLWSCDCLSSSRDDRRVYKKL